MALYFVYRINGGEVMTVSTETHASTLGAFFGEIQDPTLPNGNDLAVKKIKSGTEVRNATAPEIANFAIAEAQDDAITSRANQTLLLDLSNHNGIVYKAIAQVVIDELNVLRTWLRNFKTEVAASTNLANLQSRVAGLSTLNDRTGAQARTAIKTAIESGAND